jgi:hypothetical protein
MKNSKIVIQDHEVQGLFQFVIFAGVMLYGIGWEIFHYFV